MFVLHAEPVARKIGIFKDDLEEEEEEDEGNTDIDRVNQQLRRKNEADQAKFAALSSSAEASIYDYDGEYDKFKAAEVTSHPLSRASDASQPVSHKLDISSWY